MATLPGQKAERKLGVYNRLSKRGNLNPRKQQKLAGATSWLRKRGKLPGQAAQAPQAPKPKPVAAKPAVPKPVAAPARPVQTPMVPVARPQPIAPAPPSSSVEKRVLPDGTRQFRVGGGTWENYMMKEALGGQRSAAPDSDAAAMAGAAQPQTQLPGGRQGELINEYARITGRSPESVARWLGGGLGHGPQAGDTEPTGGGGGGGTGTQPGGGGGSTQPRTGAPKWANDPEAVARKRAKYEKLLRKSQNKGLGPEQQATLDRLSRLFGEGGFFASGGGAGGARPDGGEDAGGTGGDFNVPQEPAAPQQPQQPQQPQTREQAIQMLAEARGQSASLYQVLNDPQLNAELQAQFGFQLPRPAAISGQQGGQPYGPGAPPPPQPPPTPGPMGTYRDPATGEVYTGPRRDPSHPVYGGTVTATGAGQPEPKPPYGGGPAAPPTSGGGGGTVTATGAGQPEPEPSYAWKDPATGEWAFGDYPPPGVPLYDPYTGDPIGPGPF